MAQNTIMVDGYINFLFLSRNSLLKAAINCNDMLNHLVKKG